MSQSKHSNFAALTFEIVQGAGGIPSEAHLLPVGPFRASDGRPAECAAWQLDAQIAQRVIAIAAAQKNDILIDFEHQSLRSRENGKRVEAAGWVPRTFEWREGKGLFATNIAWVSDTPDLITQKKYRYISTVFFYNAATGEVLEIVSIALTNTPALDGLEALADLARKFSTAGGLPPGNNSEGDDEMPDKKQLAALTAERDAANTKVAALTADLDKSKAQVVDLTKQNAELSDKVAASDKEKAEAALAADKAKHAELLQAALTDGRLTPAQKAWAEKQSLADLTEYLDSTNPLALLNKQTGGKGGGEGSHGLTQVELAECAKMGVSPEEFVKAKRK